MPILILEVEGGLEGVAIIAVETGSHVTQADLKLTM